MNALLLLLLDSRSPAGAHNHSGGMEPAVTTGLVRDLADVEEFCRRRLHTAGRVNAAFAAVACDLAAPHRGCSDAAGAHAVDLPATAPHPRPDPQPWADLDAEFDARTPSEAMRAASRQLGRGLGRLVRSMLPGFTPPWNLTVPHHPLVLGAAVAAAGGTAELAARAAALGSVAMPASAAVRLLGLDPFAVQTMLARLAAEIDSGELLPHAGHNSPRSLAADAALDLDLLADFHLTTEVRLFAS